MNNSFEEFITEYKNFLLSKIPTAKPVSGGKEINCRCMYCADSKNIHKGHFYISIPKDGDFSKFNCFKCSAQGYVTPQRLLEWGLYDTDISIKLGNYNKSIMKNPYSRRNNIGYGSFNIRYDMITDDDLTRYKLDYINKRLGTDLSYDDCIREKIVLNIKDIFKRNPIKLTRTEYIIDFLDSSFIGFLSYDNAKMNMRNLEISQLPNSINRRYINYNVIEKEDSTQSFYCIPNSINTIDPIPIKVHIAEGPFDVLSIYHNLRKTDYQSLYISVTGKGYKGIIRFCLVTLGLINVEFHIYPDMDIKQYVMDDIADLIYPYQVPLYIHRNVFPNEKDFGVPIDRIRESIYRMR